MSSSLIKKITPGLFGKFLILMLATGAAISAMLGLYWRVIAQPQYRSEFHSHIEYYQQLLSHELGDPPAEKKAKEIAQKLRIGLRYESKDDASENWQTDLFPQGFEEKYVNKIRRGQSLSSVQMPGGRLLIHMRLRQEIETIHIFAVVGIVTFALFIAWLVSRYLLKPVRELRAGMAAIEAGRLDLYLKAGGGDELAVLKHNFNSMTQTLKAMLADRDRLLADVSHELRSPLTRMKLALEFNKDKKTTKTLRGEIDEMQAIIAALLDTERLAAGPNPESIDVQKLLNELCRDQKVQFTAATSATVNGSREKFKIVLRNVIENAKTHGAKPVTASCRAESGVVVIRIADSGKGVAEGEREKIFMPFYRTNGTANRGYGLGLYMAKKIVGSMRGTISVVASDKGTTMEIRLPAA